MTKAKAGDRVKIHYTIKLTNGEIVGTSKNGMPLSFKIGHGKVIRGLEQGVIGMQAGESRTIEIAPEQGYGRRNEELVTTVSKEELPAQMDIAVGRTVQYLDTGERMVSMIVTAVGEKTVRLDANHPFAGHPLAFEIILVALS
ncbi:MAG: peptidylprolyl isomerase [Desulfosarcina sp.]|nr:peptidylprolyl isomerase [Desulfobacterales bacterium]